MNFMNNNALVSVIVPVYKVEKYLNQCINTIVHQTYKNLEIILVDDGSPDECPKICDSWGRKDSRIKVIHKSNGGLSDARNEGLTKATGKYLLFVDSDDWISLNMVSDLVKIMDKENADMGICQFADVFPDGRIEANSLFEKDYLVLDREETFNRLIEDTALTNHVWRKMYRRNLVPNNVFPKGKNFEDIYAMPDLLENCDKVVCTNKIEYFYRQNDEGIIQDKSVSNYTDQLSALNYAKNRIIFLEPKLKEKVLDYQVIKEIGILRELTRDNKKEFIPLIKKMRKSIITEPISTYKNVPGKKNKMVYSFLKLSDKISFLYDVTDSLKKIYRPIKNVRKNNLDKKDIFKKIVQDKKPKFYIIGTPEYGNLGDQALMFGEFEFIKQYFPEYTTICIPQRQLYMVDKIKKYITKKDIVGLQAGGNIGTLYPGIHIAQEKALNNLKDKKLVIFPQTFYYENSQQGNLWLQKTYKIYKDCKNLTVFVRDNASYKLLEEHMPGVNVRLVPDMVLKLKYEDFNSQEDKINREGALILLRNDSEQTLTWEEKDEVFTALENNYNSISESDMHVYHDFASIKEAKNSVGEQLKRIQHSELVVTDRLHGMLFAYLTHTSCIVLKSKSPKILGVYNWIKERDNILLVDNVNDFDKEIKKIKTSSDDNKVNLENSFNDMAKIIRKRD